MNKKLLIIIIITIAFPGNWSFSSFVHLSPCPLISPRVLLSLPMSSYLSPSPLISPRVLLSLMPSYLSPCPHISPRVLLSLPISSYLSSSLLISPHVLISLPISCYVFFSQDYFLAYLFCNGCVMQTNNIIIPTKGSRDSSLFYTLQWGTVLGLFFKFTQNLLNRWKSLQVKRERERERERERKERERGSNIN